MTTTELEQKILATVEDLRQATADLIAESKAYALADHIYRHSKSVAFLSSSGTVAERQAHVDKACREEREKAHAAEAMKEALREKVRALSAELSAYQTLAGLMRSEMNLAGRYEQ